MIRHLAAILVAGFLLSGCASRIPLPAPAAALTAEEARLADMVNDLRKTRGLPPVPVTLSLFHTAKWHVVDLARNAPHTGTTDSRGLPCGLHSWSDGRAPLPGWAPLCYTTDHLYARGMWAKPEEIGGYDGYGYEIVYWNSTAATAEKAMDSWMRGESERALILEDGRWRNSRWPAMGVAIEGKFAAVWFGNRIDPRGPASR